MSDGSGRSVARVEIVKTSALGWTEMNQNKGIESMNDVIDLAEAQSTIEKISVLSAYEKRDAILDILRIDPNGLELCVIELSAGMSEPIKVRTERELY